MNLRIPMVLPLFALLPLTASANFSSGLTNTNDPVIQRDLLQIRQLAKVPTTATHEKVEEVILKALVQTYGLAEMNLYDFDRLIETQSLESIMKSKKKDESVYADLLALRNIQETLQGALKAIMVKEAEDSKNASEEPDYGKHILAKIAAMKRTADEKEAHFAPYVPGSRKILVDLALEEMNFYAEDLHDFFVTGNHKTFGTAEQKHTEITTQQVRNLRKSGIFAQVSRAHEQFKSPFAPQKGETGINVAAWMKTDSLKKGT